MITICFVKDKRKRTCGVCKKNIDKGTLIFKHTMIYDDSWKTTRMYFAHLDCMIKQLSTIRNEVEELKKKYDNINFKLERYDELAK